MKIYDKIIYEVATKNIVTRQSLLALGESIEGVNKQIRKAIKDGLVREKTFVFKSKSKKKRKQESFRCLMLTGRGLEYVQRNLGEKIPWLQEIEIPTNTQINFYGNNKGGTSALKRYMLLSTASVLMDVAGSYEHLLFVDSSQAKNRGDNTSPDWDDEYFDVDDFEFNDTQKEDAPTNGSTNDLSRIILDAWNGTEFMRLEQESCAKQIIYTDSIQIKNNFHGSTGETNARDLMGCRFTGYVESEICNALVYVATELTPAVFNRALMIKEFGMYRQLSSSMSRFNHASHKTENIIIVTSEKSFQQSYYAKALRSKTGPASIEEIFDTKAVDLYSSDSASDKYLECGERFDNTWVISSDRNGAIELRMLLSNDLDKETTDIVDKILKGNKQMRKNEQTRKDLFPLADIRENMYAIGTHINIQQIQKIEAATYKAGIQTYILCQRWQMPYYNAVLRNAKPYPIDEIIDFQDYSKSCEAFKMACEVNGEATVEAFE